MILDGRKGDRPYYCYDAKRCRMVKGVVWVNDDTAQWGRYVMPAVRKSNTHDLLTEAVQEERITIYVARKLVIFNEVDDREPTESTTKEGATNAHR